MKTFSPLIVAAVLLIPSITPVHGQTNATAASVSETAVRTNTAIVPVPRTDGARRRQETVLQRAKDNPGECDIVFIGDSITQGWEMSGKAVWDKYFASRKALNFGVGGDRTQHVLWRIQNGQVDGLKPKAGVVLIGTNNSSRDDNTEGEILEGVQAIVRELRQRLPGTKLIVMGIFPRSQRFTPQRGKILQVNQALARMHDGQNIHYVDIGSDLIEADGSISRDIMPDFLHLSERGYEVWARAIDPKIREWVGK